jgi:predicted metal-binding protein
VFCPGRESVSKTGRPGQYRIKAAAAPEVAGRGRDGPREEKERIVPTIEKVRLDRTPGEIAQHLQRYVETARQMGASRAAVVDVEQIVVDDRVPLKCRVPRCFGYGACANCPPHTMTPGELREYLRSYGKAVFFTKDVAPEVIARNRATIKERIAAYLEVFDIVNRIESMAFYDGHYLAFGLGAGSCRHSLCAEAEGCRALSGQRCRFALKARPSLEAVGVDVFRTATLLGWDIYPIGSAADPADIPAGSLAGLVVVL